MGRFLEYEREKTINEEILSGTPSSKSFTRCAKGFWGE
jgi:hypothetical protein